MCYSDDQKFVFDLKFHNKDAGVVVCKKLCISKEEIDALFPLAIKMVDWERVDIPGTPYDWDDETRAQFLMKFIADNWDHIAEDDHDKPYNNENPSRDIDELDDMWVEIEEFCNSGSRPRFVIKEVNSNMYYREGFSYFATAESFHTFLEDEYDDAEFSVIDTLNKIEYVYPPDDDSDEDSDSLSKGYNYNGCADDYRMN